MHPVERYLLDLTHLYRTGAGTDELSYYTPLLNLLNAIGRELKPKVEAVGNLADAGALSCCWGRRLTPATGR